VKGVSKGLIGVVAQPVSGGLEFFSSAFEGIDASSSNLVGRQRNPRYLQRRRLPRAIGGDGRVEPLLRMAGNVMTDDVVRLLAGS
jgi:vacuolar protein sorting-associated protein 13A/C